MRLALFGILVLTACSTAPTCPVTYAQAARAQPFLWRVTSPSGSLTIQATHGGVGRDAISSTAWAELDGSSIYVTETDEAASHAPADPGEPSPMFHLLGTSLDQLISPSDFRDLQQRTDVDPAELRRMKPWVAFILLGKTQVSFAERSMNAELLDRARMRGESTIFLDTWDDQVQYLDAAITPRKLSAAIRGASAMGCDLERRIAAFRAGDDAVFANDIKPDEPVVVRIERWYGSLRTVLDSRRAFVAVGVGQLLGPYGLLSRFARDGYQVERL